MLGIGGIAIAGFGAAASAAASFERQIDQFGAITGATAEQLAAVSDRALQLGQDTIFSANQVAGAIAEMSKAGVSTEDILAGAADAAVHLAAATDTDLTTSVDIATAAMNTFNLTGGQLEGVVDAIAKAANASSISVEDIGTSLKYAGGPAHALGLSIDETTLAIGLLGKAGIAGSTAGTSLRRILLNLSPASKEAAATMQELGIITADGSNKFYDAQGNAKSLRDIMGVLSDATKNLSAEQKVQALNTIFGNRAVSSAILLANQGAAGYDEFAASLSALPSAADISAKRLDNLSGDIEILKGNIDTMLTQAGTPFQEMLRSWVQEITKLLQSFQDLSPETQKLILQVLLYGGAIFVAIGATTILLGTLIKFVQQVRLIGLAIQAILKFTGIWGLLAKGLAPLNLLILRLRIAMLGLNTAFLANPIVLVIAAIVALAAVFVLAYKHWKPFHDGVDILWQSFQNGIRIIGDFVKRIGTDLVNAFNTTKNAVTGFYNSVVTFFTSIPSTVGNALSAVGNFLAALPGQAATALVGLLTAFGTYLQQLPPKIAYWIGFAIGAFLRFVFDTVVAVQQFNQNVIEAIVGFVASLPDRIATFLEDLYGRFTAFVTLLVAQAILIGIQVVGAIIGFFAALPGEIARFVTNAFNAFISFVPKFVAGAQEIGSKVLNGIVDFVKELPGRILGFFRDMINTIAGFRTEAINTAKDLAQQILNSISDIMTKIPDAAKQIFQNMIDTMKDFVSKAYESAKNLGGNMWQGFKDGIGIHSPSFIEKATTALVHNVSDDIDTLKDHVKTLQGLGVGLPDVAAQMNVNLVPNDLSSSPQADSGTVINMEFNGVTGGDAAALKSTLSSTAVLTRITQAAKAGRKS